MKKNKRKKRLIKKTSSRKKQSIRAGRMKKSKKKLIRRTSKQPAALSRKTVPSPAKSSKDKSQISTETKKKPIALSYEDGGGDDGAAVLGEESTLDKTPMRIYLQQIEHIPLLTPEEEYSVAQEIFTKTPDAKAARMRMIRSNLRLVISIAKRYANMGLPFSDLVEEGNIGLMRAVDKFNYKKGYRFSTYASWWIKQAMMRALSNQGKMIRIPVYMYDIITKWRKVRDGLTQKLGRMPTRKEIADTMEVPIRKVKEIERIASQPTSLNAPVNIEGAAEVIDLVEDETAVKATENVREMFTSERIEKIMEWVDEREKLILALRFGLSGEPPKTLEDTAKHFGITRERVRQIEVAALQKIREKLHAEEEQLGDYVSQ